MKLKIIQWLMALLMTTLSAANAWAADVNCSLQNVGSFDAYFVHTATVVKRVVPVIFEVWCDRGDNGGQTSTALNYSVAINNGANVTTQSPASILNKAQVVIGTTTYSLFYDFYTADTCATGTQWSGLNVATTIVRPQVSKMFSRVTLYGCVDQSQSVPDSTYQDSVKLTLTGSAGTTGNSVTFSPASPASLSYSIPVNLTTPPICTWNTKPTTIDFGPYTSFQPNSKNANTPFTLTCTPTLPFDMALYEADGVTPVTYGVIAGLNFSLGLGATSSTATGVQRIDGTKGTVAPLSFQINGNMPAGQAGSCAGSACSGATSKSYMLSVSY